MMKAGVIGVGAMGRHHARVYNQLKGVELVAVADVNMERAEEIARCYKVRAYRDYRTMLEEEELQVVSVAVPTRLHLQVASDVFERGVSCLLEKPIAPTVEEGQEIIASANERGVKMAVGHVERFNPAILELKRKVGQGELGRLFLIHARRLGPFPERIGDVGVVIDLATHDLDIICYLTGSEVTRVYAETAQCIHTQHEDLLSGLLRFSNGAIGVLDINWLTPTKIRELSLTGERGMFLVNLLSQDLYFYENSYSKAGWDSLDILRGVGEGDMVRLRVEKMEPLRAEIESFLEWVVSGKEPPVSGAEALQAVDLAQRLIEAAQRNAPLAM